MYVGGLFCTLMICFEECVDEMNVDDLLLYTLML